MKITITPFNEAIIPYPKFLQPLEEAIFPDDNSISTCLHNICRGYVDIKPVSETHQALICRNCNLRVVISNEIKTWGQLKAL